MTEVHASGTAGRLATAAMLAGTVGLLAACGNPTPAPGPGAAPPAGSLVPATAMAPLLAAPTGAGPAAEPPPSGGFTPAGDDRLDAMVATLLGTGQTASADPTLIDAPCDAPAPGGYTVPTDFAVSYVISPVAGDWGVPRRLTVDPQGRYRLVELVPPPPGSLDAPAERALADGRVRGPGLRNLYAAVVACGFFDLRGPFFDDSLLQGSTEPVRQESTQSLSVTADGRSHQVVVRNVPVQRFVNIRSTLFAETHAL